MPRRWPEPLNMNPRPVQDNTLTEPYAEMVAPQLASALEQCKRTFPDRVVLFSNSAGLQEFDPDGGASHLGAVPKH